MLKMIKKTWNSTTDKAEKTWNSTVEKAQKNWLQISLGGIFSVSLATFNVVFPAAIFPTLVTLATLAIGSAMYFIGKAIVSFFHEETAPVAKKDTPVVKDEKGSTAAISSELEANKTKDADQELSEEEIALPTSSANLSSTSTVAAVQTAANEEEEEEEAHLGATSTGLNI